MPPDHWLTASLTLNLVQAFAFCALAIWSIQRELHLRGMTRRAVEAINKSADGYRRVVRWIRENRSLSREEQRALVEMLKETKREQAELVLDIEGRLREVITRESDHKRGGSPLVQMSTGPQATNQAGENHA
jgi:hypothetical protein